MGQWQRIIWGFGFCGFLLLSFLAEQTKAENSLNLVIEGKQLIPEVPPQIIQGRTLVPIRVISEGLGANVDWNTQSQVVTIQQDKRTIQIPIGKENTTVNGSNVPIDSPAQIIQERTFVPIRFVSENLGINVAWDENSQTVFVSKPYLVRFNGKNLHLEDRLLRIGTDFYVPLANLSSTLGIQAVVSSDATKTTVIYYGKTITLNTKTINNQLFVPVTQIEKKLQIKSHINPTNQRIDFFQFINLETYQNPPLPKVFNGNLLFIWKAENISQGNVEAMINQAKQLGVSGVFIKYANGSLVDDPVSQKYMDQFKRLVGPFKAAGFKVGGWIYQYLSDVPGEVDATSQAIEAGADFIVLDGEDEVIGKNEQVTEFGKLLRAKYPKIPVGFSSYAVSHLHSTIPFKEYNEFVNVMMPQIYWADMEMNVEDAFNLSITDYSSFKKPILPTGQLYGAVTPTDIERFTQLNNQYKLSGISWWDWDEATNEQLKKATCFPNGGIIMK
ncbi:MAG TPA: copper amine oxidase N-terminal domain-containing protein [Bacillota bacterium]|nr:copper amine oxidase N-terminal domain-containing protein [Bacillota bacterium]